MKTKKFFTIFDKDKFVFASKIIVLFLFLVAIFNLLDVAYSKYESKANMYADANIAFFIVEGCVSPNPIVMESGKRYSMFARAAFAMIGMSMVRSRLNSSR